MNMLTVMAGATVAPRAAASAASSGASAESDAFGTVMQGALDALTGDADSGASSDGAVPAEGAQSVLPEPVEEQSATIQTVDGTVLSAPAGLAAPQLALGSAAPVSPATPAVPDAGHAAETAGAGHSEPDTAHLRSLTAQADVAAAVPSAESSRILAQELGLSTPRRLLGPAAASAESTVTKGADTAAAPTSAAAASAAPVATTGTVSAAAPLASSAALAVAAPTTAATAETAEVDTTGVPRNSAPTAATAGPPAADDVAVATTSAAAPTAASAPATAPVAGAPVPAADAGAAASVAAPVPGTSAPQAAAPAPVAPPAPTPVPQDFAAQLARPIANLRTAGSGEHVITVNVTPENLGPVTVRAHVGADGMRIELISPSDAGREALKTILTELRRDLAGLGIATPSLTAGGHQASASATLTIAGQGDQAQGQQLGQQAQGEHGAATGGRDRGTREGPGAAPASPEDAAALATAQMPDIRGLAAAGIDVLA